MDEDYGNGEDVFQDAPSEPFSTQHPEFSGSVSSMIFERNVEEPHTQMYGSPSAAEQAAMVGEGTSPGSRSAPREGPGGGSTGAASGAAGAGVSAPPPNESLCRQPSRRALEDMIAPALDAGASLVAEPDTDLDNVEMIYSRRPSTLGLDMALGRTRTSGSHTNLPMLSRAASNASFTSAISTSSFASAASNASGASGQSTQSTATAVDRGVERPRVLRFYSYADMLSDENAHSRRPSLSQSLSNSWARASPQPIFTNSFKGTRRESLPSNISTTGSSCRQFPQHSKTLSRSPTGVSCRSFVTSPSIPTSAPASSARPTADSKQKGKFHLESSGSDCSTSEDESDQDMATSPNSPTLMNNATNSQNLYNTVTGPRLSRTSTQNSFKKAHPPYSNRTYSFASNISPFLSQSRSTANSAPSGNTQNMNDVLYNEASSLQSNSVGEVLRRKMSSATDA
ncbi:LAMI_0C08702g1_1 [Lachancea mirantina]|uniref:LAMI_0C08702g1_1 n=1 Tax=Lachancea mirantina TaxID=1230905 RepID=A0A1G4J515_9SACH|nr:LAMI_0C08702g1_1 [Lachancea mirantina]